MILKIIKQLINTEVPKIPKNLPILDDELLGTDLKIIYVSALDVSTINYFH